MNVTMLGRDYMYNGTPMGADSTMSETAKSWVALIMEKGLPYYEAQRNINKSAQESAAMAEALKYVIDNGLVAKGAAAPVNYTPWIIGGVVVVLVLGGGAFAMKRRRR
jgi:hypothetical protein